MTERGKKMLGALGEALLVTGVRAGAAAAGSVARDVARVLGRAKETVDRVGDRFEEAESFDPPCEDGLHVPAVPIVGERCLRCGVRATRPNSWEAAT
jgi:hypothetical protein